MIFVIVTASNIICKSYDISYDFVSYYTSSTKLKIGNLLTNY